MTKLHERALIRLLLIPLAALALDACASGGRTAGEESDATFVVVENNLTIPSSLTIYAQPQVGVRTRVGSVRPNTTTRLRFSPISGQQYRFIARTNSGAELASNPVTVIRGQSVQWNVHANIATALGPD